MHGFEMAGGTWLALTYQLVLSSCNWMLAKWPIQQLNWHL